MAELIGIGKEAEADAQDDVAVSGFHNPLFSNAVSGAPKDERLFPTTKGEEANERRKSSSMVMRRHMKKDCRQDGTLVDKTKRRVDRSQKITSERQMRRVSSLDVPACVAVKSEDASDAGEILQHCAFHMEAFRVHTKNQTVAAGAPTPTTFMFVFHGGQPNQATLEVTHTPPCLTPARGKAGDGGGEEPDPTSEGEGRVTMTLGGNNVPHRPGEPYSCYIRQVGHVTFNPRKQARGYLYILSQEGRTLFTSLS
ncbi:unnamed protein product [Ectocarpus sp. CCAP 1310/34]|nr:unnamed protein product [Ectocarpus sp. CCAP 1310/34]